MSNAIKIGNLTIDSFKVGAADCSIYLGTTKLYPQGEPPSLKYKLILSDSTTVSGECDGTSAITQAEISAYSETCVSAEIGDCVTSIGVNAFRNFSGITSMEIPDSVASIGDGAFRSCTNLASISLPSSVTSIGGGAFRSCTNLASVAIPSSVSGISYDVFSDCVSLTSVTIPSSVTNIGYTAFKRCSGLTSVDIPSGVTRIGFEAFNYCSGLTSITVEAVVPPTLEQNVFNNTNNCPIYVPCESLTAYQTAWSAYTSRITCIPTHEYVDLGLPSGTKWATMNVGASSETDYGNYYQYGKGADDYQVTSGQSDYSGTENPLAASADTAVQVWGGSWHTPTQTQFEELTATTTDTWETINGVNGAKFTATNGNYVFFPAAGEYDSRGYLIGDGYRCYYRSSTFYTPTVSCTPKFENGSVLVSFGVQHKEGCSIRPVMDN